MIKCVINVQQTSMIIFKIQLFFKEWFTCRGEQDFHKNETVIWFNIENLGYTLISHNALIEKASSEHCACDA